MARLRPCSPTTVPARWPDCCPSALSARWPYPILSELPTRWPDCVPSARPHYRLDGPTAAHPHCRLDGRTAPICSIGSMARLLPCGLAAPPLVPSALPARWPHCSLSAFPARWPDCSHPDYRLDGQTASTRSPGSMARPHPSALPARWPDCVASARRLDGPSASQPHHWLDGPTSFQPHNLLRRQPNCRPLCRRSPPKSAKSRPLLRQNAGGVRETWSAGPPKPSTTQQGRSKTPLRQATKTH